MTPWKSVVFTRNTLPEEIAFDHRQILEDYFGQKQRAPLIKRRMTKQFPVSRYLKTKENCYLIIGAWNLIILIS